MDAVILAGGKGTRLASVSGESPKVLMPVAGRPFLSHLLDQVRRAGVSRVILSTGYQAERLGEFAAREKVLTCAESEPLGTGGGLRNTLSMLTSTDVLVMNGDSYVDADLKVLTSAHRGLVTMLLTAVPDTSRYGRVETINGKVSGYVEKGAAGPGDINAGVYVIARSVIESIPTGRAVSLERDVFPGYIGKGLRAVTGKYRFIDIGTPESYKEAEAFFAAKS